MNRYQRQIIIPELGIEGQKALAGSKVLCVGLGGIGSPVLVYLASAGIGKLGLIDGDSVDESNLQRQFLFKESQVSQLKAEAAAENLRQINSHIEFEIFTEKLSSKNVDAIVSQYDLVIDGTDNYQSKFLIGDACVKYIKPMVYGSVNQFDGQVAVFYHSEGPCYRCYQRNIPEQFVPNCSVAGVLGPSVGVIGSYQALEAIKTLVYLKNKESTLRPQFGRISFFDFLNFEIFHTTTQPWAKCSSCGASATPIVFSTDECEITTEELWNCYSKKIQLVDIREELVLGFSLDEAFHWPLSRILKNEIPADLDPGKELVFVCETGFASKNILSHLKSLGFSHVKSLKYGLLGDQSNMKDS